MSNETTFTINLSLEVPAEYLGFPKPDELDDLEYEIVEFAVIAWLEEKLGRTIDPQVATDLLEEVIIDGWEPTIGRLEWSGTGKYGTPSMSPRQMPVVEICSQCHHNSADAWCDGDPWCVECIVGNGAHEDNEEDKLASETCIHGVRMDTPCSGPGCEGAFVKGSGTATRALNPAQYLALPPPAEPAEPVAECQEINGVPILRRKS